MEGEFQPIRATGCKPVGSDFSDSFLLRRTSLPKRGRCIATGTTEDTREPRHPNKPNTSAHFRRHAFDTGGAPTSSHFHFCHQHLPTGNHWQPPPQTVPRDKPFRHQNPNPFRDIRSESSGWIGLVQDSHCRLSQSGSARHSESGRCSVQCPVSDHSIQQQDRNIERRKVLRTSVAKQ